jgi:hypothetical protein
MAAGGELAESCWSVVRIIDDDDKIKQVRSTVIKG